jgi:chaperone required for assembly of F1-ATPase
MQRFWDRARVEPAGSGWQVTLDGRALRVPGGGALTLPTPALAEAVAAEWQAAGGGKGGALSYEELPLTRIAGTGQERIAPDPEPIVLELARYGESDLLCYRAAEPEALALREHAAWQPWLDWAARRHGARLRVTTGIVHVAQDPAALAALAGAVAALDPFALAALGVAVPALGSLVLGLALADRALDAAAAHALATLDELFQEEFWGQDELALRRRDRVGADVAAAGRFLGLLA